jgi:hypothetical protein
MNQSRRSVAKRVAGSSSFRPGAAQNDRLDAATRAKSPWVNVAAFTGSRETLIEQMYQRYRTGLPPEDLMVGHGAPAPHAASSAELCS